jgi:hypothetical protein
MHGWLDANCGADSWAMTPAGLHSVVNDAVAVYFLDATLAAAFVTRWCAGSKAEISEGHSGCVLSSPSLGPLLHRPVHPELVRHPDR